MRARTDNRRVANAAEPFVSHTAGGCSRGEIACLVERDGADCSEVGALLLIVARTQKRPLLCPLLLEGALKLLPSKVRAEIALRDKLNAAAFLRERLGASAHHQDVRRLFHDESREPDGVLDARHASDRAGHSSAPVHDCRIQFVCAFVREHGALPGVELRRVFKDDTALLLRRRGWNRPQKECDGPQPAPWPSRCASLVPCR